jgi:lipopolysaccharide export system permease protein
MKILDRYIFKEILFPFLIALVALTFVAFLTFSREIGLLLELIVRQSATTSEIWALTVAILPNVLTFTIPMAVLVGILTGFGRMSSDSEAIAFRASDFRTAHFRGKPGDDDLDCTANRRPIERPALRNSR